MNILTGFGYFIKDGKRVSKYILRPGTHPDPVGCTFVEVASKEELDKIALDKTDEQIASAVDAQVKANRNAFIDALMSGDTVEQDKIKESQASLKAQKVEG